jgi:hypothetical protein
MNSTLSPGLLVSVFASRSRGEWETRREDMYLRNDLSRGAGVGSVPKLGKRWIAVFTKVAQGSVK